MQSIEVPVYCYSLSFWQQKGQRWYQTSAPCSARESLQIGQMLPTVTHSSLGPGQATEWCCVRNRSAWLRTVLSFSPELLGRSFVYWAQYAICHHYAPARAWGAPKFHIHILPNLYKDRVRLTAKCFINIQAQNKTEWAPPPVKSRGEDFLAQLDISACKLGVGKVSPHGRRWPTGVYIGSPVVYIPQVPTCPT